MIAPTLQMSKLRCRKGRKQGSQGWRAVSSFPGPPALYRLVSSLDYSQTLTLPWLPPHPTPRPGAERLPQGHSAWPGRSSDLNPGLLAPGLPYAGQPAGLVPWVSHAPGLWPSCQALWSEFGDEEAGLCEREGLPWQQWGA